MAINSPINTGIRLTCTKFFVRLLVFISFILVLFSVSGISANAAELSLSPSSGTFVVGNTFTISVVLNTEGQSINAIETLLQFPSDKLQLVSPSTGISIISLWTNQPNFDNQKGTIALQGGIPNGINTSNGIVTTLTFRVKNVGSGLIKFLDNSKALLNDGLGTNALNRLQNGIYNFILPPPAGPIITSSTHPDQSKFYSNPNISLIWLPEDGIEKDGYSYILDNEPATTPDDISEGNRKSITYKNQADGIYYFHIKSLRQGSWGGTTHFAVNIDATPPAQFPIEILPFAQTSRKQPLVKFNTTDVLSGLSHYELKIIAVSSRNPAGQPLFIEVQSPYLLPELETGKYDLIVRAYDKSGNYKEVSKRLQITPVILRLISEEGVQIGGGIITISWVWVYIIAGLIFILLLFIAWRLSVWHKNIDFGRLSKQMPNRIKQQLNELKQYQSKYGKLTMMILFAGTLLILLGLNNNQVLAQTENLNPPIITTISKNISNQEIFYAGGKVEAPDITIIIYLQNLQTGETKTVNATSNKKGEWFYQHNTFLGSGNYLLWVQSKIGEETSPPSPQVPIIVRTTAIQIGASRLSYETLYLLMVIFLLIIFSILIAYSVFHYYHGKRKHKEFLKEIREAEIAVSRGFIQLRRDIHNELNIIKRAKIDKELSQEEREKESILLHDLERIEKYITKELMDIGQIEQIH